MAAENSNNSSSCPYPWLEDNWQRLCAQLSQQRLAHAYLICGEEGLGKKQFAHAAAGLLLCSNPSATSACNSCKDCLLNTKSAHPDLYCIAPESDSKVIKIEQIRALANFVGQTRHSSSRKVIIMERADTLNINAANALLKTLEEPTDNTVLFLVSDKPGSLLATIRSRAQRISFKVPSANIALPWLQKITNSAPDLPALLKLAGGKPLLAQQLHNGEELQQRQNIQLAFVQITQGKLDPMDFAAKAKSLDVELVMECLWQTTATLVKTLLCNDESLLSTPHLQALNSTLQQSNNPTDVTLARLMQLNSAAENARKQLGSSSNPNQQLVFESMMWRWARLSS